MKSMKMYDILLDIDGILYFVATSFDEDFAGFIVRCAKVLYPDLKFSVDGRDYRERPKPFQAIKYENGDFVAYTIHENGTT